MEHPFEHSDLIPVPWSACFSTPTSVYRTTTPIIIKNVWGQETRVFQERSMSSTDQIENIWSQNTSLHVHPRPHDLYSVRRMPWQIKPNVQYDGVAFVTRSWTFASLERWNQNAWTRFLNVMILLLLFSTFRCFGFCIEEWVWSLQSGAMLSHCVTLSVYLMLVVLWFLPSLNVNASVASPVAHFRTGCYLRKMQLPGSTNSGLAFQSTMYGIRSAPGLDDFRRTSFPIYVYLKSSSTRAHLTLRQMSNFHSVFQVLLWLIFAMWQGRR